MHSDVVRLVLGCVLLVAGVLKIGFGFFSLFYPGPLLDTTVAGTTIHSLFIVFGLFALLRGGALLHAFSDRVNDALGSPHLAVAVYVILGILMTVFFATVMYTDRIDKNPIHVLSYELLGFLGGLVFLFMAVILLFLHSEMPRTITIGLGIVLLGAIAWTLRYVSRKHAASTAANGWSKYVGFLIMIPLAGAS